MEPAAVKVSGISATGLKANNVVHASNTEEKTLSTGDGPRSDIAGRCSVSGGGGWQEAGELQWA